MLTFFSIPKPFEGEIGEIQRRAIASWREGDPEGEVLLFGDDGNIPVETNDRGTPLVSDAFAEAERRAANPYLCYVNTDILLPRDVLRAVHRVASHNHPFLVVGECWSSSTGRKRGADAIDYFVFTPGLFGAIPPFAIGRMAWDNWLVWRARGAGALVVDATRVVHPIHQDHDYAHMGGLSKVRTSPEAKRNYELAGGKSRFYSRFDATHVLTRQGLRPNLGAPLRWKEKSRRAAYKVRHVWLAR